MTLGRNRGAAAPQTLRLRLSGVLVGLTQQFLSHAFATRRGWQLDDRFTMTWHKPGGILIQRPVVQCRVCGMRRRRQPAAATLTIWPAPSTPRAFYRMPACASRSYFVARAPHHEFDIWIDQDGRTPGVAPEQLAFRPTTTLTESK